MLARVFFLSLKNVYETRRNNLIFRTWILDDKSPKAKDAGPMGPEEPEEIVIGVKVLVNSFFSYANIYVNSITFSLGWAIHSI